MTMRLLIFIFASLAFSVLGVRSPAAEQTVGTKNGLTAPTPEETQTLKAVATILPKYHLSKRPINDELARLWLRRFLKELDPDKIYFNQSDVDRFLSREGELPEMAKRGDLSLGYEIAKLYLQRLDEATGLAKEFLQAPHDFALQEEIVTDPELVKYAADNADAREKWRKRIKLNLLQRRIEGATLDEARAALLKRYESFRRQQHQFTDDDLLDRYLACLALAYDPHSLYTSPKKVEESQITYRQQLDGIGVRLRLEDDYTTIVQVVPGGPAAKEGHLQPGDRIVGVGQGEAGAIKPIVGLLLPDVISVTRGKRGTIVRLEILPKGQSERVVYSITRSQIQVQEARGVVIERGQKADGSPLRIGYLHVPNLYTNESQTAGSGPKTVTRDVRKILEDPQRGFKAADVDAVILDLRTNYGGVLSHSISLSGTFIGPGTVLQVKGSNGRIQQYNSQEKAAAWEGPLVVLTSRNTASGAEIIAGALQDYGRALIIGDSTTAGLGTIQSIYDLGKEISPGANSPKLGALKVTTLQFYRVNGESTQLRGVKPDVVLPSYTEHLKVGETFQPGALPFDQVPSVPHGNLNMINADQKSQLQNLADQRRAKSAEFRRLAEDALQLEKRNKRKSISLNEDKARDELRKIGTEENTSEWDMMPANYYNDEVLAITADYLRIAKLGH
jgi:carboxyl-terminal processing protease